MLEELHRKTLVLVESGCWVWLGRTSPQGYGMTWDKAAKKDTTAHRLVYLEAFGPMPDGWVVDHLCRMRSCVRPDHLEAVPNRTNVLRGAAGALLAMRASTGATCASGHPRTPENVAYYDKNRPLQPHCKVCRRERARAKRAVPLAPNG